MKNKKWNLFYSKIGYTSAIKENLNVWYYMPKLYNIYKGRYRFIERANDLIIFNIQ